MSKSNNNQVREQVPEANARYASDLGERAKLALPPARRFAVLTCMDARIDPAQLLGLREGDAHVIRNAGGRASDDAIRSLVISYKLLGADLPPGLTLYAGGLRTPLKKTAVAEETRPTR